MRIHCIGIAHNVMDHDLHTFLKSDWMRALHGFGARLRFRSAQVGHHGFLRRMRGQSLQVYVCSVTLHMERRRHGAPYRAAESSIAG